MINQIKSFSENQTEPLKLVNVVRSDASFSTRYLRDKIFEHLSLARSSSPSVQFNDVARESLKDEIKQVVNGAYAEWGHEILGILHITTVNETGEELPNLPTTNFHLYDAGQLSQHVIKQANEFVTENGQKPILVSLDDIVSSVQPGLKEIAFSRLFSLDGRNQYNYVARPGHASIETQMAVLKYYLDRKAIQQGCASSIVFLEDNVRHAKMLNWLNDQMEKTGVLDNATIAGISSCFCCADADERTKIQSKGRIVPVQAVVDYNGAEIDVITPRDLLFDGFVVDIKGENKRLPGIFMDVVKRFKIEPESEKQFRERVIDANIAFCTKVEQYFNMTIPVEWFAVSDAIIYVTGKPGTTPMRQIMQSLKHPGTRQYLRKLTAVS